MTCPRCAQKNPDTALNCSSCNQQFAVPEAFPNGKPDPWRQFIGPRADYYLERFRSFQAAHWNHFRPSWHWPAFGVGWLWFLYRKMYVHAAVFLIGGLLPMLFGAGLLGAVLWNGVAGVTANFLYYLHVKFKLEIIQRRAPTDKTIRDVLIADAGGVQPYVWWLGVGLMAFAIAMGILQAPVGKK